MLEIAFHNERQHRQIQHDARGALRLDCAGSGTLIWHDADDKPRSGADAILEIAFDADSVVLQSPSRTSRGEIAPNDCLAPGVRRPLPVRVQIGEVWVEIVDAAQAAHPRVLKRLHNGAQAARKVPGTASDAASRAGLSPETLCRWFGTLGALHRSSGSIQELFHQAARSAVDSIGLDGAMVLRFRDGEWEIAASNLPHPELGILVDRAALRALADSRDTQFHPVAGCESEESTSTTCSQPAVVVSALTCPQGELRGAIYGYRSIRPGNERRGIRYLEAHLIELLANAVSEGMLRMEQEAAADRRRAVLEQVAASHGVDRARKLVCDQREATLLFADLRDFTQISATLETDQVCELLSQVMDLLTSAVMEHDGLVIDYFGDGLAAMWNAPAEQADHPQLACRAALRMLDRLPALSADWLSLTERELRLGVGVNTGRVQVGNAGSSLQAKYGPRGANVHLTSRVEAASKFVGVPLLVTEETASRLSNRFVAYRVCRAELAGIHRPINLFGVVDSATAPAALADVRAYADALAHFESGQFEQAAFQLSRVETGSPLPVEFLGDQIEHHLARSAKRRHTDQAARWHDGVIRLHVK